MRLESSLTNQSRPPPAPSQWEAGWGVVSRRTGCQKHLINPGVTDSRQALQPRPQRGQVSSAASIFCASLSLSLFLSLSLLNTYNHCKSELRSLGHLLLFLVIASGYTCDKTLSSLPHLKNTVQYSALKICNTRHKLSFKFP